MTTPLTNPTILFLEDEPVIALDMELILETLGAGRIVAVGSIAQALEALDKNSFDLAVLDMNVGGDLSIPVADKASASGAKIIFATGYDLNASLLDKYGARHLPKPYTKANVDRALRESGMGLANA